jgi:hypothetical protein
MNAAVVSKGFGCMTGPSLWGVPFAAGSIRHETKSTEVEIQEM